MEKVKAKKHLGQHFLKDESIAAAIADTLNFEGYQDVLEIGPGMGVLTKYLLAKPINTYVIEIDTESVTYLDENFPKLKDKIISKDFLKYNINETFEGKQFGIIGNFPYNISTQIVFRAFGIPKPNSRICWDVPKRSGRKNLREKGTKAYGILSVLVQAFYDAEYLFTVDEHVFIPPPKVKSGVLRLRRKADYCLPCGEKLFFTVVKTAFQQRRKTLRNSLKTLNLSDNLREDTIFDLRPEQLNVQQFIELTQKIEADAV